MNNFALHFLSLLAGSAFSDMLARRLQRVLLRRLVGTISTALVILAFGYWAGLVGLELLKENPQWISYLLSSLTRLATPLLLRPNFTPLSLFF